MALVLAVKIELLLPLGDVQNETALQVKYEFLSNWEVSNSNIDSITKLFLKSQYKSINLLTIYVIIAVNNRAQLCYPISYSKNIKPAHNHQSSITANTCCPVELWFSVCPPCGRQLFYRRELESVDHKLRSKYSIIKASIAVLLIKMNHRCPISCNAKETSIAAACKPNPQRTAYQKKL